MTGALPSPAPTHGVTVRRGPWPVLLIVALVWAYALATGLCALALSLILDRLDMNATLLKRALTLIVGLTLPVTAGAACFPLLAWGVSRLHSRVR
jgi:hypothetical protein